MATTTPIHAGKTPVRIHYIKEWARRLGKTPADITEATGADKSLVSRWFSGTVPKERYLVQLKELFELDEISALFRDPEDDWIAQFFRNRNAAERERMLKAMLDSVGLATTGTDALRLRPFRSENFDGSGQSSPAISGGRAAKEVRNK